MFDLPNLSFNNCCARIPSGLPEGSRSMVNRTAGLLRRRMDRRGRVSLLSGNVDAVAGSAFGSDSIGVGMRSLLAVNANVVSGVDLKIKRLRSLMPSNSSTGPGTAAEDRLRRPLDRRLDWNFALTSRLRYFISPAQILTGDLQYWKRLQAPCASPCYSDLGLCPTKFVS
jgi:hypothetical protein